MHGVMRVVIMWDISNTNGEGTAASFVFLKSKALQINVRRWLQNPFPRHETHNMAGLVDNIESRQYIATGVGIWLNSCIVIKLGDSILFWELTVGLCLHHQCNHLALAILPKWNLSSPPAVKLRARCDISLLEDFTLAFTPAGKLIELPQYCLQSPGH